MSWHFIERWLQKVNQHSTLIGKFWITFLIVFRIVVVSSVGDRVYSDEQTEFKCNTLQVGCPNICFNKFSPISHIRFWSFQIVMVSTPSIIFMVYSAHTVKKKAAKEKPSSNNSPVSPEKTKAEQALEAAAQLKPCPSDEDNNKKKNKRRKSKFQDQGLLNTGPVSGKKGKKKDHSEDEKAGFLQHYALYTVSVLLRTVVEVCFIFLQYKLFGFNITELYKCVGDPCPNEVDCYVSRPKEKTIFVWFMFVIAVLSFALNIAEIYYLSIKFGQRRARKEKKMKLKFFTGPMQDITIHDAEIVEGDVIAARNPPRHPPPEYRGLSKDEIDGAEVLRPMNYSEHTPIAMRVNMDDDIIRNHFKAGIAGAGVGTGNKFRKLSSSASYDQTYASPKQEKKNVGRGGKKGNDYLDYV